jgi:glycerol-3-phosphate acyltransferase PlsY
MAFFQLVIALLGGYVIGSFPSGVVWVKLFTGKDVREVGSGRTGGTNAMRAAGFGVGLLTAVSDIIKGTLPVLLAQWLLPPEVAGLGMVLAGLGSILGHNYSLFLGFKGGAGGATAAGAAMAIWPWIALVVVPLGAGLLYFVGYASVATIAAAVAITVTFAILASLRLLDPTFILFGLGTVVLLVWALRPNIARLMRGEERLVGRRAKLKAAREAAQKSS